MKLINLVKNKFKKKKPVEEKNTEKKEIFTIEGDVLTKYNGDDTYLRVPNTVKVIGAGVFQNKKNLKSVTLPDELTTIEDCAFLGCKSLRSIKLPNTVIEIGDDAFKNCKNLPNLSIPTNIKRIGKNAGNYTFFTFS